MIENFVTTPSLCLSTTLSKWHGPHLKPGCSITKFGLITIRSNRLLHRQPRIRHLLYILCICLQVLYKHRHDSFNYPQIFFEVIRVNVINSMLWVKTQKEWLKIPDRPLFNPNPTPFSPNCLQLENNLAVTGHAPTFPASVGISVLVLKGWSGHDPRTSTTSFRAYTFSKLSSTIFTWNSLLVPITGGSKPLLQALRTPCTFTLQYLSELKSFYL